MPDYGLRIYNETGTRIIYDSSMVAWNQIDEFSYNELSTSSSLSFNFPGKEILFMYFFDSSAPATSPAYLPNIYYSNTYVQATKRGDNLQQSIRGLALMR